MPARPADSKRSHTATPPPTLHDIASTLEGAAREAVSDVHHARQRAERLRDSMLEDARGLGESVLSEAKGLGASVFSDAKGLGASVLSDAKGIGASVLSDARGHLQGVRRALPASKSQAVLALKNTELHFLVHAPWLLGLFVPPPSWPPESLTVKAPRLAATLLAAAVVLAMLAGGIGALGLLMLWVAALGVPLLVMFAPMVLAGYIGACLYWRRLLRPFGVPRICDFSRPAAGWAAEERRCREEMERMEELLSSQARCEEAHDDFLGHVSGATSLAVYGCGILAATHVGGLFALQRYGLDYKQLNTLAGVSAGAVIVACLSVGYDAEAIYRLVTKMPFHRLAYPELGALFRALGNTLLTLFQVIHRQGAIPWALREISQGNGPGINSGAELDRLMGDALAQRPGVDREKICECGSRKKFWKCCARDLTLGQVKEQYGKRVIILVTELDTGRERQLTPETDADLPLRIAVRMSMGVPGLIEPFRYGRHVYCDGGMCNDFPMNALPDDGHRLGLMVRPRDWYMYNFGSLHRLTRGVNTHAAEAEVIAELTRMEQRMKEKGIYPVRDGVDLATTCMQTMMDANLALQIRMASGGEAVASHNGWLREGTWPRSWASIKSLILQAAPNVAELPEPSVSARLSADETAPSEGANSAVSLQASSSFAAPSPSFFQLAPQIVTLCGGSFSPFDFGLTKIQHEQLFVAGQISVHMTAAQHAATHLEKDLPIPPDDNHDLLGSVVAALSRAKDAAASVAASAAGGEDSASEANAKLPSHEGPATPEVEAVAPVLSRQTKLAFLLYLLHMEYRK